MKEKFLELRDKWHHETCVISNPNVIFSHACYLEIIELGKKHDEIIKLIFDDLQKNKFFWLRALEEIFNVKPNYDQTCFDLKKIHNNWINYGKENGYINNQI